ncbi:MULTISPECIES: enoyl-CoA hydratase-related protein [unclassified Exiguobacterium]|uniref:enoyl-CoA hydratase/isomerase family protein n=1 Tax=unclassified Exiguobacterium TaxID=2644629 RepID=UPI001BEB5CA7|nr:MULTISPECIES: enoyl-CoA hydratase-related protein [unclassified Exiguobacterium]
MKREMNYAVKDQVATLTLARPKQLNALTSNLLDELADALEEANQDEEVRVIVLTGEGRGFCAGQDLKTVSPELDHGEYLQQYYHPVVRALAKSKKPTIAAINGVAAGAGLSLTLACDFRLVDKEAKLSLGFINIGLVPDAGAPYFLPRLIGAAKATELALLGDTISADEAVSLNLATRSIESEQFVEEVTAFARQLADRPTKVIGYIKQLQAASYENNLEEMLAQEIIYQSRAGKTEDHRHAVESFIEKKRPVFVGR